MRRRLLPLALMATMLTLPATPANASITEGADVCSGSADINGVTYTPANDTPGNAIPLPDEEGVRIPWRGTADMDNSSHSGSLAVVVAGFNIRVANWSGGGTEKGSSGVYELDDFYDELESRVPLGRIPGVWRVSGEHMGDKRCAGFAMIKIEGNPLGTAFGWIVVAGLLLTLAGVAYAMRGHYFGEKRRWIGRPILGAVSGLFLGLFLALALMTWGIRPLDQMSVFVIPLVLLVIAVGLALWGPLGRGKKLAN